MALQRTVVKEVFSTDMSHKAVIYQRADTVIEVITLKWNNGTVPGHGKVVEPFWEQVAGPSLTDIVERAEQIAAEQLRRCSA